MEVIMIIRCGRHWQHRRLGLRIFEIDSLCHGVEVERRITFIIAGNILDLSSYAVDRLIREFFGDAASATHEDLYEPHSYLLVFAPGSFPISTQPVEKRVERFLSQVLFRLAPAS